ncbi:nuclease [Erysipelotrichaceae bacterium MTC7]|nr:nuclease [Erysipelotrichaceae bacterium MTC7]
MSDHAVLSASGAHRWLNCLPSARLELEFVNNESSAAAEGTAAHALCEHKLKKALHMRSKRPVSVYNSDEMEEHSDAYVEFVMEQLELAKQSCTDPLILIEQRLDFSCYVPQGFGTGDCIIIADKKLHIIDFKYGMGVLVDAVDNPQMKLYALGALEIYDSLYDIEEVSMTIFQPRRENVSTWTIRVEDLKDWAEKELKPRAKKAYDGEGEYLPGEWCTFCRAAAKCRARAEEKLKLAQSEFKLPPLLTDSEIEEVLSKLSDLTKWANEIIAYATDAAVNHGKEWHGFKVVEGRSVRKYKDEDAVAEVAKANGYKDIFRQSLITLTEMERLMGKSKFEKILGDLIYKPPGKPTLVPLSDKRPAMNVSNAKNEFNEITEECEYE